MLCVQSDQKWGENNKFEVLIISISQVHRIFRFQGALIVKNFLQWTRKQSEVSHTIRHEGQKN